MNDPDVVDFPYHRYTSESFEVVEVNCFSIRSDIPSFLGDLLYIEVPLDKK